MVTDERILVFTFCLVVLVTLAMLGVVLEWWVSEEDDGV